MIEENAPGVGFYLVFIGPGVGFWISFLPRGGNLPIKNCPGFTRGEGWSGLELTDTYGHHKEKTRNMQTICGMINSAMSP